LARKRVVLHLIFIVGACAYALVGCGDKVEHTTCVHKDAGDLVTSAAAFKLTVYNAPVRCDGNDVDRLGDPITSGRFAKNQPIKLDIPPGHHTLLLTTYADANAATQPTGSACTEQDLTPGGQVCFDLPVTTFVPGCRHTDTRCCDDRDCVSPPAPAACYAGSCPAPDAICSYTQKESATICGSTCCNSLSGTCKSDCSIACLTDRGNCNGDVADGCEIDLSADANNCGACKRPCATGAGNHVDTAACTGSACSSTCQAGYANCSRPLAPSPDDGCECASPGCCKIGVVGFCQVNQNDAFGHSLWDCLPHEPIVDVASDLANNWNQNVAAGTTNTLEDFRDPNNVDDVRGVCIATASECVCWAYTAGGIYNNRNYIGHALRRQPDCSAISAADFASGPTWP
jgi:hypothetical protein